MWVFRRQGRSNERCYCVALWELSIWSLDIKGTKSQDISDCCFVWVFLTARILKNESIKKTAHKQENN